MAIGSWISEMHFFKYVQSYKKLSNSVEHTKNLSWNTNIIFLSEAFTRKVVVYTLKLRRQRHSLCPLSPLMG
jgi:hypothetical protein